MWYLPMGGHLRAVKIVFWVIVAISALSAISSGMEIALMNQLIAGKDVADSQLDFNDAREAIIGLLGTLALVAGAITFIIWLYRAYQNADAVAPGTRRYAKGWVIAGWFVPIMWFFRPKQIINDVWRAGGPPHEPSGLLAAWWTLWIIGMWVSNFAFRRAFDDVTPESVRTAAIAYLISAILDVATAILAIRVASTLTARLDERAKNGPPQPRRFDRDESMTSEFPTAGSVAVPPKFGSGQAYR